MNILLMTNTYLPHVGGVARSVACFEQEFRRLGHNVLVIAPEFEGEEAWFRVRWFSKRRRDFIEQIEGP